ncbi:helix-turn-helix transcriptional regulator [Protofrankia symbiont of Coriaria ruscifolia]|uniref:ArsR family transcriptional regulator n=1 Tax=Candidatus Protofrankia californiensis TaxID=1839754 RepID=A0A1C3NXY2_9ACTN|nr:ArsR family transcriptional regulator [Protofrankia symbiont of Coriaria ruscifolia]SBW22391.1 ArsR family transcriptional regulator [Candidatus Protofrankia californiensis]
MPDTSNGTAADGRTRDRVVRLLLELGPSTAVTLSANLGLSPAAIRRHLDAMLTEGVIMTRSARTPGPRGRGRPARVYQLTAVGHAAGPTAYEDLATSALSFLADVAGHAVVAEFAEARAADLERRVKGAVSRADPADRPAALAAAMSAAGYTASASQLPTGIQICQHHCPVQHVAEQFPELCGAETAALSRLLDSHVQRLATIAHGDGVCTTHVPLEARDLQRRDESHDRSVRASSSFAVVGEADPGRPGDPVHPGDPVYPGAPEPPAPPAVSRSSPVGSPTSVPPVSTPPATLTSSEGPAI